MGRIVTFYSFKGGVGRTMALANVAFLAQANGKRVLVMDWDLEAPGLHYYFRGMQDVAGARSIRSAPGVLDLAWSWSNALREAKSTSDVERIVSLFRSGTYFRDIVRPLLSEDEFHEEGRLDYIGAGSSSILTPSETTYEEALSKFNWESFFSDEGGGVFLNALRDWARSEYDYVFIDSRTGFADVAGICTMQMPDVVALCYIYNRQNIDGISQVAGAIRNKGNSSITLRGVPMRVARENTSEEAEARARARKELSRKGGFTNESVENDQKLLSIKQAPNVPFYETIALVSSDRPRSDQLALDYLNLSSQLLGEEFHMPVLSPTWVETVRRRIQAKQVAPEYITDLLSKDTQRGIEEVTQLLEGAQDEHFEGDVDEDYLDTLIAAAVHVARNIEDAFESEHMLNLALDLVRSLAEMNPSRWERRLGDFLEFYLEQLSVFISPDEELILLDEADSILIKIGTDDAKLRRLTNRRRAARIQLLENNYESVSQIIGDMGKIFGELQHLRSSAEVPADLVLGDVDFHILRGDVQASQEKYDAAKRFYESGLRLPVLREPGGRPEALRLGYELHSRLARLPSAILPNEAGKHAVQALDWTGSSSSFIVHFLDLGEAVLRARTPQIASEFLAKSLKGSERRQQQIANFYSRTPSNMSRFLEWASGIVEILTANGEPPETFINPLLETLVTMLERGKLRARGRRIDSETTDRLREFVTRLATQVHISPELGDRLALLAEPRRRARPSGSSGE